MSWLPGARSSTVGRKVGVPLGVGVTTTPTVWPGSTASVNESVSPAGPIEPRAVAVAS